jgi:hypothetical protein
MDITERLTIGQTFFIDNPPHEVMSEEWTVVEFSESDITFLYTKYWVRDIAYVHISTTDTVTGIVLKETKYGIMVELKKFPYFGDVGLLIKGDKARYLSSFD